MWYLEFLDTTTSICTSPGPGVWSDGKKHGTALKCDLTSRTLTVHTCACTFTRTPRDKKDETERNSRDCEFQVYNTRQKRLVQKNGSMCVIFMLLTVNCYFWNFRSFDLARCIKQTKYRFGPTVSLSLTSGAANTDSSVLIQIKVGGNRFSSCCDDPNKIMIIRLFNYANTNTWSSVSLHPMSFYQHRHCRRNHV